MSAEVIANEKVDNKDNAFFRQKLTLLYRKLWIIILAFVVGIGLGVTVNYTLVKPTYTATEQVFLVANLNGDGGVENSTSSAQTNATLAQIFLPETARFIKSAHYVEIANQKMQDAGLDDLYGTIKSNKIKVNYGEDILIFTISYTDVSATAAAEKLKAVVKSAEENLANEKIGVHASEVSLKPMQSEGTNNVKKNSSVVMYGVLGGALGLVLSVAIILLINALDNTVKSKEELEELTGASVVAYIEDREILTNTAKK